MPPGIKSKTDEQVQRIEEEKSNRENHCEKKEKRQREEWQSGYLLISICPPGRHVGVVRVISSVFIWAASRGVVIVRHCEPPLFTLHLLESSIKDQRAECRRRGRLRFRRIHPRNPRRPCCSSMSNSSPGRHGDCPGSWRPTATRHPEASARPARRTMVGHQHRCFAGYCSPH